MLNVMARMKLLFSLPFCFLIAFTAFGQEIKRAASGEEHAIDTLSNHQFTPSAILTDTLKKDTISTVPKTDQVKNDSLSTKQIVKTDSTLKKKPFSHPVFYYLEIGIAANSYRGDLSSTYKSYSPSLNIGVQLNRKRWLNGYFGISIGQVNGLTQNSGYVSATDANLISNTYFNTIFFAAKYELNLNIVKNDWITAYVGLGIGFLNFTPYDQEGSSLVSQSSTRAKGETYTSNSAIFPVSAGVRFSFKNYWAIHLQASLMNQTTAYIDNIKNLSTNQIGDNILGLKFAVLAPLKISK